MFETVRLIGSDEVEIPVYTRLNRQVRNSQAPAALDDRLRQKYRRLLDEHRRWEQRKAACGVYNCCGHVWASRRTAIYEQPEIDKILQDDGYRALPDAEQPVQGDLALYYVGEVFYHVGLVCELRALMMAGEAAGRPIPWILSKWDNASGEALHHLQDVPWPDARIEFQTDRPI